MMAVRLSFRRRALLFLLFSVVFACSSASPDQGKWENVQFNQENSHVNIAKSLYNGSKIFIQILCDADDNSPGVNVTVRFKVIELRCWEDSLNLDGEFQPLFASPTSNRTLAYIDSNDQGPFLCAAHTIITLDELFENRGTSLASKTNDHVAKKLEDISDNISKREAGKPLQLTTKHPVFTVHYDGVYLLQLDIGRASGNFNASVTIEMSWNGHYLSAADWPLLPFYGAMCLVYVLLGLAWLLVSFCQWRDLLRIQFWIGGVILLGMLEKAMFYAEYQSVNSTGTSMKGAVLLAELVSCAKRMLARMLVIIVSLGFGIVKPRLGPMLHRVVGTGTLYFALAAIESYLRVMHQKNDPENQILVASIPLAVLDSAICWWIFTSLVQTTRTLRLRRNMVKLSLYKHFTNTLIFSVISSVVFMLYSIKYHKLAQCLTDWKELWVDEAYWHLLFSVLLLVIMILWRPTNNNQRYAFTPLLDAPEDDDDEEEEQFVNEAFGVKMRGMRSNSPRPKQSSNNVEDDLKWVEENIPLSMADSALPIMDSDEEIMTTKFEVSKMQ